MKNIHYLFYKILLLLTVIIPISAKGEILNCEDVKNDSFICIDEEKAVFHCSTSELNITICKPSQNNEVSSDMVFKNENGRNNSNLKYSKKVFIEGKIPRIPLNDFPNKNDWNTLKKCKLKTNNSRYYYYGIRGFPQDFEKARKCAYIERESNSDNHLITDDAILMMIYANGKGVTRNSEAALFFGLEFHIAKWTLDEITASKNLLADSKITDIDACDSPDSTSRVEACADLDLDKKLKKFERGIELQKKNWAPESLVAYNNLLNAADEFFLKDAEIKGRFLSCGGNFCTGGGLANTNATVDDWKNFYDQIVNSNLIQIPKSKELSFKKADAALNASYKAGMKSIDDAIAKANNTDYADKLNTGKRYLKTAQLAWIRYRDTWNKFLITTHQEFIEENHLVPGFFKIQLTEDREKNIREYISDIILTIN